MKKRILPIIFSLLTVFYAACLPALAETTAETTEETTAEETTEYDDYSGPIDPFSGDEKTGDDEETEDNLIYITDSMYYSKSKDQFAFPVGDTGIYFYSDIPDGGLSLTKLTFNVPDGITATLYRNGTKVETDGMMVVSQIGDYRILATLTTGDVEILSFSVINSSTGSLEYFRLPEGFHLVSVYVDEEEQEVLETSVVDLTAEGTYKITYICPEIDKTLETEFTVDHTAPEIELSGVEDGYAESAVEIVSISEEASVAVYYKGELQENAGTRFTKAGSYRIIASDMAGNVTIEDFTIKIYFNISAVVSLIILGVIVIIVAVYLIIRRKRLRVR